MNPVARKPLADFLAGQVDEVVAERYLERIVGRMIDVNYHLITEAMRVHEAAASAVRDVPEYLRHIRAHLDRAD